MIASAIRSAPGASIRKFTPKGRVGERLHARDRGVDLLGGGIVAAARKPKAPAFAGRGRQLGRRHPAHAGLHDRARGMPSRSQRRVWRAATGTGSCARTSRVARRLRGRCARGSGAAPRRSARASRAPRRDRELEAGRLRPTSSTVTPGCTETRRIEWSGVAKSKTPRFETTRRIVVEARACGPSAAARS